MRDTLLKLTDLYRHYAYLGSFMDWQTMSKIPSFDLFSTYGYGKENNSWKWFWFHRNSQTHQWHGKFKYISHWSLVKVRFITFSLLKDTWLQVQITGHRVSEWIWIKGLVPSKRLLQHERGPHTGTKKPSFKMFHPGT